MRDRGDIFNEGPPAPISMLEKLGLIGGPSRGGTGHPGSKRRAIHVAPDPRVRVVLAPGQKCVPPALKARRDYAQAQPMSADDRLASYGFGTSRTVLTPAQRRRAFKKAWHADAGRGKITVTTSPAPAGPESARTWLPKWASQAAFNRGERTTVRWSSRAAAAITGKKVPANRKKDDHDGQG